MVATYMPVQDYCIAVVWSQVQSAYRCLDRGTWRLWDLQTRCSYPVSVGLQPSRLLASLLQPLGKKVA